LFAPPFGPDGAFGDGVPAPFAPASPAGAAFAGRSALTPFAAFWVGVFFAGLPTLTASAL
jgi:hypothetical protein